jgi:hypothetical protein
VAKYTGSTEANPNGLGATLKIIGSSYVSLLQAAVVPLIFTAVVSSIANLRQVSNAAKLAWNTLLWLASGWVCWCGRGPAPVSPRMPNTPARPVTGGPF